MLLIIANLFIMLYIGISSILPPNSELHLQGYSSTSQHGRTQPGSAGGGIGSGPAPPPGRKGVSASGSGGCSLALVPAAGGGAVCLLLRRRHIVCVRRGESGRCCRFHHRYGGSRQARSLGVEVGPGWDNGARSPLALPADSGAARRLPLPPPHTHTSRGPCSPSGRPGATLQDGE